jgi:hypothetical protein
MQAITLTKKSDLVFTGFVFSFVGWELLHAAAFLGNAHFTRHLFIVVLGLVPVVAAYLGYRRAWAKPDGNGRTKDRTYRVQAGASCFLLLAVGAALGHLALSQSVLPLLGILLCLTFIPWSRVPICREHLFVSCALIAAGAVAVLFLSKAPADPFRLLLATWSLWGAACFALLRSL